MPVIAYVEAEMRDGRALDLGVCRVDLLRHRRGAQRFLVMRENGESLRAYLPPNQDLADDHPPLHAHWCGERVELRVSIVQPEFAFVPLVGSISA